MKAQAKIAEELGMDKDHIFNPFLRRRAGIRGSLPRVTGKVPVGDILVDGLGVGDVGNVVLRDRQHLAEDGIMIVCMCFDKVSGELSGGPDIVSRGFVYVRESDELIEEARLIVDEAVQACLDGGGTTDWGKHWTPRPRRCSRILSGRKTERPDDLPIIMEVFLGTLIRKLRMKRSGRLLRLMKAFLNSDVYQEYRRQLAEVKKVPDLKAQIDEYRARNYELQQSPDYAFDKMEQFQREYKSFRENPLVSDFLAAELAFCRLVQGIESRLVEHIDFE